MTFLMLYDTIRCIAISRHIVPWLVWIKDSRFWRNITPLWKVRLQLRKLELLIMTTTQEGSCFNQLQGIFTPRTIPGNGRSCAYHLPRHSLPAWKSDRTGWCALACHLWYIFSTERPTKEWVYLAFAHRYSIPCALNQCPPNPGMHELCKGSLPQRTEYTRQNRGREWRQRSGEGRDPRHAKLGDPSTDCLASCERRVGQRRALAWLETILPWRQNILAKVAREGHRQKPGVRPCPSRTSSGRSALLFPFDPSDNTNAPLWSDRTCRRNGYSSCTSGP
jgi:hypothetical protein